MIQIYDTTLRDGTQRTDISLSVNDKLNIARRLDDLGIAYIEGGWPGSNPKDAEFFQRIKDVELQQAKIAAFGSTRHAKNTCDNDPNIRARLEPKGDLNVVKLGEQVLLETETLQLLATVVDLEYGIGALPQNSYFERITLELAIWPRSGN